MSKALILCSLFFVVGCDRSPTGPSSDTPDLSSVPTQVVIAGERLTLTASLWRDFMPISPPDGKPLGGVLQIRTGDGSPVPSEVRADQAWIVYGTDVWSATPREERPRTETEPAYEVVVRDGPKWGPNVSVDVVLQLRDRGGSPVLLSVRNQVIGGTF